jgi:hypothetical protein
MVHLRTVAKTGVPLLLPSADLNRVPLTAGAGELDVYGPVGSAGLALLVASGEVSVFDVDPFVFPGLLAEHFERNKFCGQSLFRCHRALLGFGSK